MVARDFQKKISFLIKRLDAGDLTRVIVQWHRNHKRPVEEALGCVQEFYDYAGKLKQVVAQDPRSLSLHFWPLIETLVTHLQKGARETAKQRLLDNSTLKEKQSLWPELKEAGGGALSEKGKRKAEEEVYAAYGEPTKRAREGSHSGQEDEHADSRDDDEERAERDVDERTERDVDERTEHDVDERAEHDVNEHAEHHGAGHEHVEPLGDRAEHHHARDERVEPLGREHAHSRGDERADHHRGERAEHLHAGDERADRSSINERVRSGQLRGVAGSSGSGSSGQHKGAKPSTKAGSGGGSTRGGAEASGGSKRGGRAGSSSASKRGGVRSDPGRVDDEEHADA